MFLPSTNDSTLVWKLYLFHSRLLQNAAENMNVWCTTWFLLQQTQRHLRLLFMHLVHFLDHVVPLRLHNSWREEGITLFWGCGPFLLRSWRRLQRLFQKVHSVCAANYRKQRLKKISFFIEVARLNLVWYKQSTGGNIRAQRKYFVFCV